MEALTTNVVVFGGRAFKRAIKVKQNHKGGSLIQLDWGPYKEKKRYLGSMCTKQTPCENIVRKQPSTGPGQRPHEVPTLLTP